MFFLKKNKWWILGVFAALFGFLLTYANFVKPMGMGDPATFAAFGCNVSKGEVIYRDFYHFRTPGEYFINGFFAKINGCNMNSISLAIFATGYIFAPLIIILTIYLLSKKNFKLAILTYLIMITFPIASQMRVAFGFLSTALIIKFYRDHYARKASKAKFPSLYLAGLVTGATFIFGQDIAILAGFLFTIITLYLFFTDQIKQDWRELFLLFVRFGVGFLAGISPLLIYLAVNGALAKGLYYMLYYAIFLQPGGMDIPFPAIFNNAGSLIFYIPILIMGLAFIQNISQKKKNLTFTAVLVWSILRFVSAAGRSDMGHLLFAVIPEIVVLSWMIAENFKEKLKLSRSSLKMFIAFLAIFIFAVFVKSFLLFVVAILVLTSLGFRKTSRKNISETADKIIKIAFISALTIFAYTQVYPGVINLYRDTKVGLFDRSQFINSKIPAQEQRITQFIAHKNPKTIFSYPIHPYYYLLGYEHATPFMTFEPQTTLTEQEEAIKNLEKNNPEVVIFDPLQAYDLGGSINLITDYILNNYEISAIDDEYNVIWVMTPRQKTTKNSYISLNVKKYSNNDPNLISVENRSQKIRYGLMLKPESSSTLSGFKGMNKLSFSIKKAKDSKIKVYFSNGKSQEISLKVDEKYEIEGESEISKIEIHNKSSEDLVFDGLVGGE